MDIMDNAKQRHLSNDRIQDGISMLFSIPDLNAAATMARDFKAVSDGNQAIHQHQIENFCCGESSQFQGIMESFMKSTTTIEINRDIEFLQFALNIMKERIAYKNDFYNTYYEKAKDVLVHLDVILNKNNI